MCASFFKRSVGCGVYNAGLRLNIILGGCGLTRLEELGTLPFIYFVIVFLLTQHKFDSDNLDNNMMLLGFS